MKPLISIAALSFAAFALLPPVASAISHTTDASSIAKLLQQAKVHAAEANYDAEVLDAYGRSNMDWRTHAQCLNNIKEHADDLFEDFYQLQTVKDKGTPQQREAIDRMEPMLREMGTNLTNTIQNLNLHQGRVHMPSFRASIHSDYVAINKVFKLLCECTNKGL